MCCYDHTEKKYHVMLNLIFKMYPPLRDRGLDPSFCQRPYEVQYRLAAKTPYFKVWIPPLSVSAKEIMFYPAFVSMSVCLFVCLSVCLPISNFA